MEGMTVNASEPKVEFKDNKKEQSTVHKRSGRIVKPLVLYMKQYGSDGVESALHTIHKNNYTQLCELTKNIKIAAVGAGLGRGFNHASELKVMKLKEAMNKPGSNE